MNNQLLFKVKQKIIWNIIFGTVLFIAGIFGCLKCNISEYYDLGFIFAISVLAITASLFIFIDLFLRNKIFFYDNEIVIYDNREKIISSIAIKEIDSYHEYEVKGKNSTTKHLDIYSKKKQKIEFTDSSTNNLDEIRDFLRSKNISLKDKERYDCIGISFTTGWTYFFIAIFIMLIFLSFVAYTLIGNEQDKRRNKQTYYKNLISRYDISTSDKGRTKNYHLYLHNLEDIDFHFSRSSNDYFWNNLRLDDTIELTISKYDFDLFIAESKKNIDFIDKHFDWKQIQVHDISQAQYIDSVVTSNTY